MKKFVMLALIVLGHFCHHANAFTLPTAPEPAWVNQTEFELATQGDWDQDSRPDLFVVDRESGTLRVALVGDGGALTWLDPLPTGAIDATSIAFGSFSYQFNPPAPALAVTAPMLNRVQLLFYQMAEPQVQPTYGIGPNALISLGGGPAAVNGNFITASELNSAPNVWHIAQQQAFTSDVSDAHLQRGNEIDAAYFGFIARNPSGATTDTFQLYQTPFPNSSFPPWQHADGVVAGSDWACGQFNNTVSQRAFLFWKSGQASLQVRTFDQASIPPDFDAGVSFTLAQTIDHLTVLTGTTPPRLLIVFADGTSAGVFDFDGVNAPVLAHSFTPEPGQTFRHALATTGGDFHLFSGPTGSHASSSARRYRRQADGSYVADAPSNMSPLRAGNRRTNLLLYQGEPFVDESAHIVSALSARDWTSSASGVPGMLQTNAEIFQSSSTGLGQAQNVNLGMTSSFASHALANQIAADVSVIVYSPPIGRADPSLQFSPPPARYAGAVNVTIKTSDNSYPNYIKYRVGSSGEWLYFYPTTSAPIAVAADTTIQAYIDRNNNERTPILTGAYTIGSSPAAPMTGTDANHNGLGDEWEQYFGITDPNADPDGDGYTNQQEHDAHTDPGDPASHSNPAPGQPNLLITSVSPSTGIVGLRLYGTAGKTHRIEWSPTLESTSWQTLGSDFAMPAEGFIDLQDTGVSDTRRFYRATAWP